MQDPQTQSSAASTANYTINGVIEFLQDQVRQNIIKQNEWLLERQQLLAKLGKAEGDLRATETVNTDLMKRVKMLEFCLREERLKYSSLLTNKNINTPERKVLQESYIIPQKSPLRQANGFAMPKRRAKDHRNIIQKFLEEVGYDDLFAEANSAGDPHNKGGVYSSQRNSEGMDSLFKNPDHGEIERLEHISVLDNSAFRGVGEKSPDPRYSSSEDHRFSLHNDNHSYIGDDRSFRMKNQSTSATKNESARVEWKQKGSLRGHFDGVRDLFVNPSDSILCSVSEDCMIKVWDLNQVKKSKDSQRIEPYLTLREHTGYVFAVSGPPSDRIDTKNKRLIYTAGSEGLVKVWDIPLTTACETFGPNSRSYCIGSWNAHNDTIWEVNHHPLRHSLMTVSCDGYIKVWETFDVTRDKVINKLKSQFSYSLQASKSHMPLPTTATWVPTNTSQLVAGFTNSNNLLIFNEENDSRHIGTLKFDSASTSQRNVQPNKLLAHPNMNVLISAHEDRYIRFFDLNTNKLIHSILAHNDAVTSICYNVGTTNLVSVSHDGSMKIWDLKKYGLVQEITGAHVKKYDEQIHCVVSDENTQLLLSGGADGVVSVYDRA